MSRKGITTVQTPKCGQCGQMSTLLPANKNRCGHSCPHVHMGACPQMSITAGRSLYMQVDTFTSFYLKAQQDTETHVDMWTPMSTQASKTAGAAA